ncbi:MAG: DUF4349 domain-containing protein [Oscillospiraceae bacterium]|nr:DUF4349 domain-containing protein [Oscillospiraceae bacterium]
MLKQTRKVFFPFFLIAVAVLIGSCAKSSSVDYENGGMYTGETAGYTGNNSAETNVSDDRMTVKNALMSLECESVDGAYTAILAFVRENGGSETSRVSETDTYQRIDAVLRIPVNKLDSLLAYIETQGESISLNVTASDVTDGYRDNKLRLEVKQNQLERYKDLQEQAKTLDEIMRVQTEIDKLVLEIEQLKANVESLENKAAFATLTLYLRETNQPQSSGKWKPMTAGNLGSRIVGGFTGTAGVLIMFLQWLVIVVVALLPFVLLAGVVLVIVFFVLRARRRRKVILLDSVKLKSGDLEQFDD